MRRAFSSTIGVCGRTMIAAEHLTHRADRLVPTSVGGSPAIDAERPERDALLAANHTECLLGAG